MQLVTEAIPTSPQAHKAETEVEVSSFCLHTVVFSQVNCPGNHPAKWWGPIKHRSRAHPGCLLPSDNIGPACKSRCSSDDWLLISTGQACWTSGHLSILCTWDLWHIPVHGHISYLAWSSPQPGTGQRVWREGQPP